MVFPITWVAYYFGASPEWAYIIYCLIYVGVIFVRVHYMKIQVGMEPTYFYRKVLLRVVPVMIVSFFVPYFIISFIQQGLMRVIVTTLIATISTSLIIIILGLSNRERDKFYSIASNFVQHKILKR